MYLKSYYKSCKRGEFYWEPTNINGDIILEEGVVLDGRYARIRKEDDYIINITFLRHSPFVFNSYRKSRKSARILAERIIRQDIEKSKTLGICDLELLAK